MLLEIIFQVLVNDEIFSDDNNDYFSMMNEMMMFEISKNKRMNYEMMMTMFDLDYDDEVIEMMMKKLKKNISIDVDENEEILIDDNDDIWMILNDYDDNNDDGHSECLNDMHERMEFDDDGNNHDFDRDMKVIYDDHVDNDLMKIFFDDHHLSME